MVMSRNSGRRRRVASPERAALLREVLGLVGEKWTLLVVNALTELGTLRFSRLHAEVGDVSQKMLTKTLRRLERDGLLQRTVYPTVPPHVEYSLTPLGRSLGDAVCVIWEWTEKHANDVKKSRAVYDERNAG